MKDLMGKGGVDMLFAKPTMNWKENLERLFSASVNQGTLDRVPRIGRSNPLLHHMARDRDDEAGQ
jgi:hypothetical protein